MLLDMYVRVLFFTCRDMVVSGYTFITIIGITILMLYHNEEDWVNFCHNNIVTIFLIKLYIGIGKQTKQTIVEISNKN